MTSWRAAALAVADAVLAMTLAPTCAACAAVLEHPASGPICDVCWAAIIVLRPPLCRTCGDALPSWRTVDEAPSLCGACLRRRDNAVDWGRAIGAYDGALERIVLAHKYGGRRSIARRIGPLLQQVGAELTDGASCAVPVPLHPWRRLRRGFNQAADLASTLGLPVVGALRRVRATRTQTGLGVTARRRNVDAAFGLSGLLSTTARRRLLVGCRVVLVDDVRTTGATLDACARVLKDAGVLEVRALTVARARTPAQQR